MKSDAPLAGVLVVDVTRMLPGAVLARQLLELGARVIKVEDPAAGDPMRFSPPLVQGFGAGFAAMYAGAESMGLDLRNPVDASRLRRLAARAEVLVESFRPGSMEGWGVGYPALSAANPGLVYCALSSFGQNGPLAAGVGHDLNFAGLSGLLELIGCDGVPGVQIADVTSALLACSAVLAALLARARTGQGRLVDQPLARGPLPFLAWSLADLATGQEGALSTLLAGRCACYRVYTCGDGQRVALGGIEPKFWAGFITVLGLSEIAGDGFDPGQAGERAAREVSRVLAQQPRTHWLELCRQAGVPLTPVNDLAEAAASGHLEQAKLTAPDQQGAMQAGPLCPSVGARPAKPAPSLGQHTPAIFKEFGLE